MKAAQEVNLSMVWCILVVGFAYKLLMSLTGLYFEGVEAQGERSLVIVMAAAYLFIAMMILIGNISALAAKWKNEGLKCFPNMSILFIYFI